MARWRVTVDASLVVWGHVDVVADTEEEAMAKACDLNDFKEDPITLAIQDVIPTEAENLDE